MKQQFSLKEWLENKNAKVTTRSGNTVEILNVNSSETLSAVEIINLPDGETKRVNRLYYANGRLHENEITPNDLMIEVDRGLNEVEKVLFGIAYPPALCQKDALERVILAIPIIEELIKKGV